MNRTTNHRSSMIFTLLILCLFAAAAPAQTISVIAGGLNSPNKMVGRNDQLIVSEAGLRAPNTGRISIVDQTTGARRTLVSGLPSAVSFLGGPAGDPDGPSGLALDAGKLYVTIGVGDAVIPGSSQGVEIRNPVAPASPLFDSVLEITMPGPAARPDEFNMTFANQQTLATTGNVVLTGTLGSPLPIRLVVNLPDYSSAVPVSAARGNVKASHIYGIEAFNGQAYVVDSGLNRILAVDIASGATSVLTTFPNRANPLFPGLGGPTVEAVPDSIHRAGNRLIVTLLTGFPFVAGLAEVRAIDPTDGTSQALITGLTSAIDAAQVPPAGPPPNCGRNPCAPNPIPYFTLEFSTAQLAQAPGRLRYYASAAAAPVDISTTLITPTSMVRNPANGRIFITNLAPGTITSVTIP